MITALRRGWNHPIVGPVLRLLVGYLVLVQGLVQLAFGRVPLVGVGHGHGPIPFELVVVGVVIGSLYAMVAMGLILVYRANRIINFAQAQLGSVPAVVALFLMAKRGMPYVFAIPIVLVGGALFGGVTEVALVRRFARAPRLILTVVTLGIGLLLLILELYAKLWIGGSLLNSISLSFNTPFSHIQWRMGTVIFNANHVIAVVVAGVMMVGLACFFRFTDIGIAVRASAENGDRATLLGIPVRRVSTIVWVLASVLSATGVFLRAPLVGLPLGGFIGPSVLLYGLAVAVMARMDSLPTALAAGMFVGIVQQASAYSTGRAGLADLTMFVLVLVSLLTQRDRMSRAFELGASTWQAVKDVKPIPIELRSLGEVRRVKRVGVACIAGLVVAAPFILGTKTGGATIVVIYAMIGVSLVVLTGWAGQISLGQYAIAAMGAATAAGLAANHHLDFFVTLAAAALAGAVLAVLVGLPALRIQGLLLAVTTLAFAFAVQVVISREYAPWLLPKNGHVVNRPVLWGRLSLDTPSAIGPLHLSPDAKFFYVCVVFLCLVLAMARSLRTYRSGRVLMTVRDNPRMAQSLGVNLTSSRLAAFAMSGLIAGLAGGLLAYQNRAIASNAFPPERSIELFVLTVIGGIGSLPGAILGAAYVRLVPLLPGIRDIQQVGLLTSGVGLLVLLNFVPGGLAELAYRGRDAWLRRVAARRGLVVPSLVADVAAEGQRVERAVTEVPPDAVLVCQGVEVSYDRVQVLFGVDLHVRRAEILALLGTNGAGKSTLLKAISGLVEVSRGSITFEGVDITNESGIAIVGRGVVQVPGGKAVFPTLTVEEHLRAAGWLYRDEVDYLATAIEEVLDTFPRLRERLTQRAGDLSGGEQQMLALGMAFIARPRLLLIDELSLGLAPAIVEQLLEIVRRIQQGGTAIVLVEQSVNVALTVADRAYFLEKGEVRFEGPTTELLARGDIVRSVFLAGAARNGARPRATSAAGRSHAEALASLRVEGLSISFGGIRAVDDATFDVRRGEVLGLIGPNGAGKTTILDLVSGFLTPDHGTVALDGVDVTNLGPDDRAWLGLGRSFQDARLSASLTVAENIALGFERHLRVHDHFASMLRLPDIVSLERSVAWSVDDVIELMGLGAYRDKLVRELSTGTRRIVDLGICLAHEPSLLLLDEPSSGIAQRETEALGPLLKTIQRETGCALLVIEHDMPLITSISDRLIALELGHPIADGAPGDVVRDPRVVESYLGGSDAIINRSNA